jgi:hypothetical protein
LDDDDKELLRSLLTDTRLGRLVITRFGRNREEVVIDPSLSDGDIALDVMRAFDRLSRASGDEDMTRGLAVHFENMELH